MNQQDKREYWAGMLALYRQSELSIKQFCLDHDIQYKTFYYWSKKLNQTEPVTQLQPIVVTEPCTDANGVAVLVLNNGIRVELPLALPALQIKHWLEALQ
ncbi:IS66 family insertion sequence element accessory protein TnpA [Motilimonas eburnea]|uniref:IS66 family insertion sequence element accessory protein TnpA n=1 Tax=Motilimonas eburnea TaxID=1737488 RepID=UPI001E3CC228|nr:helix-turn-helix domain-containing protein [Motilimonas eburnea]MCE2573910.1 helix-turn-helix domain-containing protein [Motilimonas eburnea]